MKTQKDIMKYLCDTLGPIHKKDTINCILKLL